MLKKLLLITMVFCINLPIGFSQSQGLEIGDMAPDVKLPDPKGEILALSALRGRLVLIDFWASWCSPCVKEQTELAKLYKKYKGSVFTNGRGFEIFGGVIGQ